MRAQKVSALASKCGFDWPNAEEVLAKIEEEFSELKAAIIAGDHRNIEEETGDVLFSLVNLCRFFSMDAEKSLSKTILKFRTRFGYIEEQLKKQGKSPEEATLEEMDHLWNKAKFELEE
jgi:tetrapyrrole methylase family protein/MazG family protein